MASMTQAILQLLLTRGLGSKTLGRLLDIQAEEQEAVEKLVQFSAAELTSRFDLREDVAHGIAAKKEEAAALARELEDGGIRLLIKHQEGYPLRLTEVLGESAPPVLFAIGNPSTLARDAVSFCGSRMSSELGLHVTRNIAGGLAQEKVNVVSGYAAGVDFTAHASALEAGGVTTIVLAEGIRHFRPKRDIADLIREENTLVLSEFLPTSKWAAHYAMQRNRTICGLSKAVVLIESGLDGGTFNAGETAQSLGLPLFVIDFEVPPLSAAGNGHFLAHGATGLRPDACGNLDVSPIIECMKGLREAVPSDKGNGSLFPDMQFNKKRRRSRRSAW